MKLRTTKTNSNKTAVQVVEYSKGKTIVIKHIGSAKDLLEVQRLSEIAKNYIIKHSLQLHIIKRNTKLLGLKGYYHIIERSNQQILIYQL